MRDLHWPNLRMDPSTPVKARNRPKTGRELFPTEKREEPQGRVRRAPMRYSPSDYDRKYRGAAIQMIMMIHTDANHIDIALDQAEKGCMIIKPISVKTYERRYGGKDQQLRKEHRNPILIGTSRMIKRKELYRPEIVLLLKEYKEDEMETEILEQAIFNLVRIIKEKELGHAYVI